MNSAIQKCLTDATEMIERRALLLHRIAQPRHCMSRTTLDPPMQVFVAVPIRVFVAAIPIQVSVAAVAFAVPTWPMKCHKASR